MISRYLQQIAMSIEILEVLYANSTWRQLSFDIQEKGEKGATRLSPFPEAVVTSANLPSSVQVGAEVMLTSAEK